MQIAVDLPSELDALFGTVVVPEAVYHEAVVGDEPQASRLETYPEGKVGPVDPDLPVLPDGFSDLGETEAMVLYRQLSADKLPIDDKRGRRIARINRMSTIGSLGVLLAAKRAHRIEVVAPYLSELVSSDVYLSDDLLAVVTEIAGEEWPVRG